MTLQSSGPISFSDIKAEFGGNNPISLANYYGRSGLPASGPISVSDFYGKSAGWTVTAGKSTSGLIVGYDTTTQFGPAFGTVSPSSLNGHAFRRIIDRVDGVSPVHNFQVQLADVSVAQNFFTSVAFVDRFGITRTFLTAGGNSFGTPTFTNVGDSIWLWSCDVVTASAFMLDGHVYSLSFV